ncbi:2-amino-4-hydroxy-6-hydroxymethyldihydropteridine diphosphokinase [Bacillus massilinigeriensis]|uniref:2-amino-4-hydroxy-6- hydroxymethyldihydropteridine diphosphokinase n=1 Tax=Bacillus massilionigeriensis TaxID=1805475 RepID=UPI00096B09F5|nr:2-amino-4-hydroxy-6-hydroxymethyldihydropteridine diphosphokinase [Bacillus massilionigeriensis]
MINQAYIALGSNIGDRYENLRQAINELATNNEIHLENTSSIYETDPVGYEDQDQFLNMVIKVNTSLKPMELLMVCQEIEKKLGRKREIHWGPRTIDLDILLYNQENIEAENLMIPHPRMTERAFVIIPLLEIDPDIYVPKMNQSLQYYLNVIPAKEGVRIWKQKNGEDVFALFAN